MNAHRFAKLTLFGTISVGLAFTAYLTRSAWLPQVQAVAPTSGAATSETSPPTAKVIVSDQAQKNLGLTARQLTEGAFWRTITVQGIVIDRPGISDQEVVAPAASVVIRIHHAPGDTVRPGELLFTVRLASEAVHEAQSELFKASQNMALAHERLKRLVDSGEGVAQNRVMDVRHEISRLEVSVKTLRHELSTRGFSTKDIDGVTAGQLLSELSIVAPPMTDSQQAVSSALVPTNASGQSETPAHVFQVESLNADLGQQVEAGARLCTLSNHRVLAIEGRAFRDETVLLERSIENGWPVEVDFQEQSGSDWPLLQQQFVIRHIANTIDPLTRTFAFLIPLENQSKEIHQGPNKHLLWRFRPGQKVRLQVRVEKFANVFVLPAEAVVREGAEAYVFTQNVNTFERKGVIVRHQDRARAVIANDGSLPTYDRNGQTRTLAAIVQNAAAQLDRTAKAGSSEVPKGFHVHADGSLHKNEDESK